MMNRFNWQVFTSFNLLFTFLIMLVSGIILYLKPEGSIARWLGWQAMGLDKSAWEAVHTVFSFLFLLFALHHILKVHLMNLRAYMVNYRPRRHRKELYLSLAISVVFLAGTAMSLPPFEMVFQAGNDLSDRWGKGLKVEHEGIDPRQSLRDAAAEIGMGPGELNNWIQQNDMEKLPQGASLIEHAHRNGISPYSLYQKLNESAEKEESDSDNQVYQKITLHELAVIHDTPVTEIQQILREKYGIEEVLPQADMVEVSGMTNQSPQSITSEIVRHLQ